MSAPGSAPKRDRVEPPLWLLFGAGGMVNAFVTPGLILALGAGLSLGLAPPETFSHERVTALVSPLLVRLALAALIVPVLFHGAHRLRFALVDVGLKPVAPLVSFLCYGSAAVTSVYCAWRLLTWGA